MPKQIVEMTVESVKMELPDTKTVRLKWPDGYEPDFKTGQFITLYFPDTQNYKRAYSLSSCALDRGHYEVTVKRDGKMGTRIVDWVKEGDRFWVIPPTGRFLPVYEPNKHLICIAGGSGVTRIGNENHGALQRAHHQRHHLQRGIPPVAAGKSELQFLRHLHPPPSRRPLDRSPRPHQR
jgi:NAD(P)H-flavin reductase